MNFGCVGMSLLNSNDVRINNKLYGEKLWLNHNSVEIRNGIIKKAFRVKSIMIVSKHKENETVWTEFHRLEMWISRGRYTQRETQAWNFVIFWGSLSTPSCLLSFSHVVLFTPYDLPTRVCVREQNTVWKVRTFHACEVVYRAVHYISTQEGVDVLGTLIKH